MQHISTGGVGKRLVTSRHGCCGCSRGVPRTSSRMTRLRQGVMPIVLTDCCQRKFDFQHSRWTGVTNTTSTTGSRLLLVWKLDLIGA